MSILAHTQPENDPNRGGGTTGEPTPTGSCWDPKGNLDHLRGGRK